MNKQLVKNFLIEQQATLIKELQDQTNTIHTMVDIDESDTMDPEDLSHQYESHEMEQMIKIQKNRAERGMEVIASLDISPKTCVEVGAIIDTESLTFIIGYATLPFELEGRRFVGISTNSPIYAMMGGKKANDSFTYAGNNYTITNIY